MLWFILFTFLGRTMIEFLNFTERETTAKSLKVAQHGTGLELPKCFITSSVTVQTCLDYSRPCSTWHLWLSWRRGAFASPLWDIHLASSCFNWQGIEGRFGEWMQFVSFWPCDGARCYRSRPRSRLLGSVEVINTDFAVHQVTLSAILSWRSTLAV